jgi:hypothetical protein
MADLGAIEWHKKGRIFVPSGDGFFKTHATRPIPYPLSSEVLRVFFSSRDHDDRMLPTFVDVDIRNPSKLLHVPKEPMVNLGEPGAFDDCGVTLACTLEHGSDVYLYYTGWKRRRSTVSFELSIGLLHWEKKTDAFRRVFSGPILGQDKNHPLLVAGPFVVNENGKYKMWYCSGTTWKFPSNNPEPIYTVFYAESGDGVDWTPRKEPVIPYKYDGEVVSAPWVLKAKGKYRMWYSTRGHATREAKNYAIGYAESIDGLSWERLDHLAGISRSAEGWDSEMVCYPAIFYHADKVYMLYSGNGVGKDGIGYAVADSFVA